MHIAQALSMPVYILDNGVLRPRITVLGLSGYARSGKDSIGQALAAHGYERASFADYIREGLYQLNPLVQGIERVAPIIDERGWEQAKVVYPEVRGLLQRLGSEVGRNILGENVWVDLTFRNLPDGSKIVVTDCRFPNEAAAIKQNGGEVWRVSRPGTEPVNMHPSETALDGWAFDRSFDNNGSLEDLHRKIDSEVTRFESGH
jgi:hypothetical protein